MKFGMTQCRHKLIITAAVLISLQWTFVSADYVLDMNVGFNNPNNTDARGVCCNEAEGSTGCSTSCDILYLICIRSSGSTLTAMREECPILRNETRTGGIYNISGPWPGGLQLLFFVEENQPDRNLVQLFQIEYSATAAQPDEEPSTQRMSHPERGGSVELTLSIGVQCAPGFHGPSCDCQNTNDSTGHFTCTRNGEIECLEGYQNPDNNCTECSTALGCSDVGGFCEQPGECMCRDGFDGENCTLVVNATGSLSVSPTSILVPTTSMTVPSSTQVTVISSTATEITPTQVTVSSSTSTVSASTQVTVSSSTTTPTQVAVSSSTTTPTQVAVSSSSTTLEVSSSTPTVTTPTQVAVSSSTSTVSTSTQVTVSSSTTTPTQVTVSSLQSSPSSQPIAISSPAEPTPSPSPSQSTQSPPLATSTPTLEISSSIFSPEASSISSTPSPLSMSPSTSGILSVSVMVTPTLTSTALVSQPLTTMTSQLTTIQQPSPTTSVPLQTTTNIQPPQSTSLFSPPIIIQLSTFITTIQSTTISSSPEPPQTTTATSPQISTQLPTSTTTLTPQSPAPPVTSNTMQPPTNAPSSGNEAVIAGTVAVIATVVLVAVITITCVYLTMKKKRKGKERQQPAVFRDEVYMYNAPITIGNPEHEGIVPRSPQLFMLGDQQQGGSSLDVTHKPTFPGVDYRQHVPYAETGPSSDHTQSPAEEGSQQVYHFRDAETTIIANPHSLSQPSDFPLSSAVATTTTDLNRRSGLGFDHRGDPIRNTHSSEQLLSTSAQSSSIPSRPESGQSSDNRYSTSPHLAVPPLPPRVLVPKTTPRLAPRREKEVHGAVSSHHQCSHEWKTTGEEDEEEVEKRACVYLQAATEEGEKRQSFIKDILFTDINLDMTTQTEL